MIRFFEAPKTQPQLRVGATQRGRQGVDVRILIKLRELFTTLILLIIIIILFLFLLGRLTKERLPRLLEPAFKALGLTSTAVLLRRRVATLGVGHFHGFPFFAHFLLLIAFDGRFESDKKFLRIGGN